MHSLNVELLRRAQASEWNTVGGGAATENRSAFNAVELPLVPDAG